MKKNRLQVLLAIMLIGITAFAFAGCGSGDENTDETTEATTEAATEATASTQDPEFDLIKIARDSGIIYVIPSNIGYTMESNNHTSASISLNSAKADGLNGTAGTLMAFDAGDTSYEDFPDYQQVGEKDGITYIMLFATDLQYNAEDSQQTQDYNDLVDALKTFRVK